MKQRTLVIGGAIIVIVIIVAAVFLFARTREQQGTQQQSTDLQSPVQASTKDPIDIASDFYSSWLNAVEATGSDPYAEGLDASTILSTTLRAKLAAAKGTTTTNVDPVLCQTKAPTQIATRMVYALPTKEEVLITAKDQDLTGQSIVTLMKNNDGWYIDDITCAPGEFAPKKEYTFEQEGYLLKTVPPPYDPKDWHLVFAQDGVQGHVVPLFFSTDSMCTAPDGTTAVCDPSSFVETTKVTVHGDMTDYGVDVKKMELTNDEYQAS